MPRWRRIVTGYYTCFVHPRNGCWYRIDYEKKTAIFSIDQVLGHGQTPVLLVYRISPVSRGPPIRVIDSGEDDVVRSVNRPSGRLVRNFHGALARYKA